MIFRQKVKIVSGFYKGFYGVVRERNYFFRYYVEIYKNDRFEELKDNTKYKTKANYLTTDHLYSWNMQPYTSEKEKFTNKIELLLDDEE